MTRRDSVRRDWDESDVRVRPSKTGSRPRTKERPAHEDAVTGRIVTVDRGRYTAILDEDTPRERLFPAIRAAARGETVLAPTVATRLVSRMRRPASEALTSREVEVLELVARGSSNADIAAALFISEATVKTHLLHTFAKLGVDDRTAAVVAALERGIIALPRRAQ